jgi:AcrR family transcriptional regulator
MVTTEKPAIRKKGKDAYHHGDLKASLKRAALRLIQEKGPRGFSLNEASRLAGVTVAAPYRHFADKDALLAEIACDGLELMIVALCDAVAAVESVREKMLEAGMAYLRFSAVHADYFAVIFNAGLDKSKYPQLGRAAGEAYGVILGLAQKGRKDKARAAGYAASAWGLVHGFATLTADGALATALEEKPAFEHLRPLLQQFLSRQ